MKKLIFGGITLFFFVALISCTEKQPQNNDADIDAVSEPAQKMLSALVLEDGVSKWTENEQGIMIIEESSELGEPVQVFMIQDAENPDTFIVDEKDAVRENSGERKFYHILTAEGQELWMQDFYLALDTIPGVILSENAFMYSKPNVGAIYTDARKLPQYHFVGIHESESNNDFVCISAYIYEWLGTLGTVVSKQYVKADAVTRDTIDLEVLQLFRVAESLNNETAKQEVLNDALSKGGRFRYLIVGALNEMGISVPSPQENRQEPRVGEEPNNTILQAYSVVPGGGAVNASFMDDEDTDWYKIHVPSENKLLRIYTESGLDTIMSLYDEAGEYITNDDDSGAHYNAQISEVLSPGTYYIEVKELNDDTGSYSLFVTLTDIPSADPYEPDNERTSASAIGINEAQVRTFTNSDDADWASFVLTSRASLSITAVGENAGLDTVIVLYDENGNFLGEDDDGGRDYDANLIMTLEPGKYFVRATTLDDFSFPEPYTLSVWDSK